MEYKKHVFTTLEKKCFMEIIKKFRRIIENKDLHGPSLRTKNEAWDQVTAEFNASPLVTSQATHKQLRRLWMNIRQRQREASTKKRQRSLDTKGGTSASDADTDPEFSLDAQAFKVRIDAAFDTDTSQDIYNPDTKPNYKANNTKLNSKPLDLIEEHLIPSIPSSNSSNRPSSQIHKSTQCTTANVMEKEYQDRRKRADEKHQLVMLILRQQFRKTKAQADLAELLLKQKPK